MSKDKSFRPITCDGPDGPSPQTPFLTSSDGREASFASARRSKLPHSIVALGIGPVRRLAGKAGSHAQQEFSARHVEDAKIRPAKSAIRDRVLGRFQEGEQLPLGRD